jgi:hypothetical protein
VRVQIPVPPKKKKKKEKKRKRHTRGNDKSERLSAFQAMKIPLASTGTKDILPLKKHVF